MDRDKHALKLPAPSHPISHLFPTQFHSGWATSKHQTDPGTATKDEPVSGTITHVFLDDTDLGVHHVSHGTTHELRTLSDGVTRAWKAFYRKGSYKPSAEIKGGFGFYLKGPKGEWSSKLDRATEVVFSYAVLFEEGFDFNKGGKLPGIFGGVEDKAFGCTGGRQEERCSCFNLRLMWRAKGKGEVYAYLPITESNTQRLLDVSGSHRNPDFGISVGLGSFAFTPGKWAVVAERVKLNDIGKENGELQLWIDGVSILKVTGLVYRASPDFRIQGLHCQTFFGGGIPEWASPRDQRAWFTGISGAIIS
ncbi:polysaccharide lyase family 14 protein [Sphaerobolus stellatus SS14]|nr:polysaccharide lyase family 14 protein [Sphaerobolus stellatus SS14]